jgi:hypothetical protein
MNDSSRPDVRSRLIESGQSAPGPSQQLRAHISRSAEVGRVSKTDIKSVGLSTIMGGKLTFPPLPTN